MIKNENKDMYNSEKHQLKIRNTVFMIQTNFTPTNENKQKLAKVIKRLLVNYEINR